MIREKKTYQMPRRLLGVLLHLSSLVVIVLAAIVVERGEPR